MGRVALLSVLSSDRVSRFVDEGVVVEDERPTPTLAQAAMQCATRSKGSPLAVASVECTRFDNAIKVIELLNIFFSGSYVIPLWLGSTGHGAAGRAQSAQRRLTVRQWPSTMLRERTVPRLEALRIRLAYRGVWPASVTAFYNGYRSVDRVVWPQGRTEPVQIEIGEEFVSYQLRCKG